MGFDNECILNIQSLAGEYFCPVCRLLVYPNEALQSQCTHLYCKPCLTYVVGTTKACPYDGYLVTEADSKPLVESNKTLAETIGKIAVHCLYHRSGCTWQGELSECVNHCAGCAFGNSPVVCNRCGTQIVHRQVQEHAQSCPGVQPQAQQVEGSQVTTAATAVTATSGQNQTTIQAGVPASQAQVAQIAVAPTSGQDQSQANTNSQPQGAVQVVPTPEQLYQQQQQQYQQYYQQYPGYDPYQQQYQQYASYQQQAYPQYQQQGSMPQAQMYMQPQLQSQTQLPVQPQAQSQSHPQPQPQVQTQPPIHAHPQAQVGVQPQVQPPGNATNQIQPSHPHPQMQPQPPQLYSQAPSHQQPHPPQLQLQPHIQQPPQVAQHQQTLTQPQQQMHPYPQQQSVAQSQVHPQSQVQPHTHVQVQHQMQPQTRPPSQPQMQPPHPSSHAVTGHQSYPQPANQQMPPVASQLQSIHMQPQQQGAPRQLPQQTQVPLPQQQLAQMRPPQSHVPMQQQQQQAMVPPQNQLPNAPPVQQPAHNYPHQPNQPIQQYTGVQLPLHQNMSQQQVHGHALHSQAFPGQTPGLVQNTPQQPAPFTQHQSMQPQLHSAVPSLPLPPASHAQQQSQQNVSLSHGFQSQGSQTYGGRPMLQNHGVPRQPYQPSPVGLAGPTHAKMQSTGVQQFPPRPNTRPHSSAEQQLGGYMHRPGVPQSGNAAPVSSSPAPMSVTKTQFSSEHPIMKPKLQDEAASQTSGLNGANVLPTALSQGSHLNESNGKPENEPRSELELKSMGGDGNSVNECEITGSHSKSAGKESLESSQALEKSSVSSTQEGLDEPVVKNTVKEETMSKPESSSVGILAETAVQNKEVIPRITQKPDGDSQPDDKETQDDGGNHSYQQTGMFDGKNGKVLNDSTESHGNVALRVKSHKNETNGDALSSQEKNILQHQSSYQDRFHQVHPISDQMSIQNRHPHQIKVRPPAHMRPQGNNILGNVPLQGHPLSAPPHFQQSMANQPRGILQSEVYPGGIAGAASFGGGPGSLGPRGHLNTGQMLPHRSDAPRVQGDSVGRPAFGGPPPGAFDCQPVTAGRLHPPGQQILSAPMDSGINANKMSGYYDGRQPDFHMPGTADRVSFAQPSNMQSDVMKMNGGSSRRLSGGPPDPSYPFGLQEERFKHFPEERYRQLPEGFNMPGEERRSGFPAKLGRHTVNPREFFDDLKKFPRPTHLDAEHVPKSENYFSSSRPLDRTPHGFISDARLNLGSSASASRLPLPSQASGPRPFNVRDDIAGRKMDHFGIHPDFHRSGPESGRLHMDGFPPFRSPGREFPDIPPTRFGRIEDNDGRESHNFGERPKPFNLHSDNNPFPERRFPGFSNHLRKEEFNVQGNLRIGERIRPMGEDLVGPDILPRHLRSGGPVGPRNLQMGESGGYGSIPNALRLGDVGGPGNMPIGGNIPSHSRPGFSRGMPIHGYGGDAGLFDTGEIESLDHTRKRKHVSNGWCRICKVDCETVEGLELHSQTREHQKMAMDMVLSIKKDNAKKHKISSDDHIAHEGNTNKTRQANVENNGN